VIQLGARSLLEEIHVDTAFYKGNYPDRCSIEAIDAVSGTNPDYATIPDPSPFPDHALSPGYAPIPAGDWTMVIPEAALNPDHDHRFTTLRKSGPFTHIRLNIFPDGGVARLRVFGRVSKDERGAMDDRIAINNRVSKDNRIAIDDGAEMDHRGALDDHIPTIDRGLAILNGLDSATLNKDLLSCCASPEWAYAVLKGRPYTSSEALQEYAARCWDLQPESEILLAFAAHPEIGNVDAVKSKFAPANTTDERHDSWSSNEQAAVDSASESVLRRLSEMNIAYRERFGYTFIICATGLGAEEMLSALESRMNGTPDQELRVAAEEQRKILHIRIEKLLSQYASE